jgi:hypothetical protein
VVDARPVAGLAWARDCAKLVAMFQVSIGSYALRVSYERLPPMYAEATRRAQLVEELDLARSDRALCCVEVGARQAWPSLVVAQRYAPSASCFFPGLLVVPETGVMFLGAGERLLAYDLGEPARLWEDSAELGFGSWARHDDVVVMSAELELAAWDLRGHKLWTRFVEPPWDYQVERGVVHLDIMSKRTTFDLHDGPSPPPG